MKKFFIILLTILCVFSLLSACSVGGKNKTSKSYSSSADTTLSEISKSSEKSLDISSEDSSDKSDSDATETSKSSSDKQDVTSSDSSDSQSSSSEQEEKPDEKPYENRTITFDTCGGTKMQSLTSNEKVVELPVPYKYGYEFLGWYEVADYSGEALTDGYSGRESTTLYAKWQENDQMVYVYCYYGENTLTEKILTYKKNDTVKLTDIFTPEAITINECKCPFIEWCYENHDTKQTDADFGEKVSDFTITQDTVILAKYDKTEVKGKNKITDNGDGTYTTTGNVIYTFATGSSSCGIFSCDFFVSKGLSGEVGVAFRMTKSNKDYDYEGVGNSYYDVVIGPNGGFLGIYQTWGANNAKWGRIEANKELSSLPTSWQNKYNNNTQLSFTMTVVSYETYFEIYLDNELVYTSTIDMYLTGCDFGIRSNVSGSGVDISNPVFRDSVNPIKINFNSVGGTDCSSIDFVAGRVSLPTPTNGDKYFAGWYYDSEYTDKVNIESLSASSDITLYAKWEDSLGQSLGTFDDGVTKAWLKTDEKGMHFNFAGAYKLDGRITVLLDTECASSSRTNKTIYLNLYDNSSYILNNCPSGKVTTINDEGSIKWDIQSNNDSYFTAYLYISYACINNVTSSSVNYNSTIGLLVSRFNGSGTFYGWHYSGYYVEPGIPYLYARVASGSVKGAIGQSVGALDNKITTTYVSMQSSGVLFYFKGTSKLEGRIAVLLDTECTSSSRTNKTIYVTLYADGTFTLANCPSAKVTKITDTAITGGINWKVISNTDGGFTAYMFISYACINSATSSSVNYNSTLGLCLGAFDASSSFSGWHYNGTYVDPAKPSVFVKVTKNGIA